MKTISAYEFRRRVFNTCLLECLSRIHGECVLNGDTGDTAEMAKRMSDVFFTDMIGLDKNTMDATKKNLSEAITFIQDCVNISETIAQDKCDTCQKEGLEIPEDQEVELSPEDEELIDKVFEEKDPKLAVDAVRDATVKALLAEDKKAQEIKDSLSIAQSQVSAGEDPEVMKETVSRLTSRGPTSLMNAIMNSFAAAAVKNVNEAATTPVSVGEVMASNADEIKTRAVMAFALYECSSVFGIKRWTPAEVKQEAERIFYNK